MQGHKCDRCGPKHQAGSQFGNWYRQQRWVKASRGFRQLNPTCAVCEAAGRVTEATQTDHIIPHAGNYERFWNVENWQAICDSCHAKKTRTESGEGGSFFTAGDG